MGGEMTENTYIREYSNLNATSLTREMHERTCGYWYTVTNGAMAHTAFRTRAELDEWLAERGLSLAAPLPHDIGVAGWSAVTGSYRTSMDRDRARFEAIVPMLVTTVLSNGERTLAKVTDDGDMRTVHFMNVNYR
jgi:hypothetical protein